MKKILKFKNINQIEPLKIVGISRMKIMFTPKMKNSIVEN